MDVLVGYLLMKNEDRVSSYKVLQIVKIQISFYLSPHSFIQGFIVAVE